MGVVFFFFFFFFSLFWVGEGEECYPYSLNNECDDFVGSVFFPPSVQQEIFTLHLALPISDVRMFPSSCRRPFIQYVCQETFSSCPGSEFDCSEDIWLFVEESCKEAGVDLELSCKNETTRIERGILGDIDYNEDGLFFQQQELDLIQWSTKKKIRKKNEKNEINPVCEFMVSETKMRAEETAVKVVTCIDANYTNITCCPNPFTRDFYPSDEDGECVVSCLQYVFGADFEENILIANTSLHGFGIILFVLMMLPIIMSGSTWYTFPTYLLPLALLIAVLNFAFLNFALFNGGGQEYICDGTRDYFVALADFLQSSSCRSVGVTAVYCINNLLAVVLLVAFTSLCKIFFILKDGDTILKIFVDQPVPKWAQFCLVGVLFIFNTICYLYAIIRLFHNDDIAIIVVPVFQLCTPIDGTEQDLLRYPTVIFGSLIFLCFGVLFVVLLKFRFFRVALSQWRSIFVSFYTLIFIICVTVIFFTDYMKDGYNYIGDYVLCVSSNPRDDPPPCTRQYQTRAVIVLLCLLVSLWVFSVSTSVYFSKGKVRDWWLCAEREESSSKSGTSGISRL